MTREQERPKESQIQFPKVPQEEFSRKAGEFLASYSDPTDLVCKVNEIAQYMGREDPEFTRFLYQFSLGCEEPSLFRYGVVFTWYILDSLKLSKVSSDTIEVFYTQHKSAYQVLQQDAAKYISEGPEGFTGEQLDEVKDKIRFLEFIQEAPFSTPRDYYEENPDLMSWISLQPVWIRTGSLVTYELKRRQFFTDQLAKQFGEQPC